MKAVILAGGEGTRLHPYTTVFPKPLMPVGGKPILEIVIRQLKSHGIDEIIMTVGYLAELIMSFFGDGQRFGVNIEYCREDSPMGTAGALTLLADEIKESFLMMNGDILTTLDYSDLVSYHLKSGSIATLALTSREAQLDFGIIQLGESNNVIEYTEKPTSNYLVSMGINVLEPKVLEYLKPKEVVDFPSMVKRLLSSGETVKGYLSRDYWLDIGRQEDYERANREIKELIQRMGWEGLLGNER